MFKHINSKNIISTEQFVREPVDNICEEIKNNNSKKIILTGKRGSGKSIILYNYENKNLGTENQCIYTIFDSCGISGNQTDKIYNDKFLRHYYELILSHKILNYIKSYYGLTYEKYFNKYRKTLSNISEDTDYYIKNSVFKKIELTRYLKSTEISQKLITELKTYLDINSLSLAIDKFDWTNANCKLSQQILRTYFNIFDKTIITSDDITLFNQNYRCSLEEKGYSLLDINYGTNLSIIKEIVTKRIDEYNNNLKHSNLPFPNSIITDEMYQNLINITNSNITLLLDIIGRLIDTWQWENGSININYELKNAINYELTQHKKLTKIIKPKKLYL